MDYDSHVANSMVQAIKFSRYTAPLCWGSTADHRAQNGDRGHKTGATARHRTKSILHQEITPVYNTATDTAEPAVLNKGLNRVYADIKLCRAEYFTTFKYRLSNENGL